MLADLPDLVPTRMLNEYVYCPRLIFLEWVDGLFASYADVAEGLRRHRRPDAPGNPVTPWARRRCLVAYDISDDKRLRAVASCMEGYGERVQCSVFVCDLADREFVLMGGDIEAVMNLTADSIMI